MPESRSQDEFAHMRGDPDFMLSLARGIRVMTAFSDRKSAVSVSQLATRTNLDRAVVRRCLYTLEHLGMVEQHDRKYRLKPQVLQMGHAYFSSADIVIQAQPFLDKLGEKIHTNCALAILSGHEVVYLVRSQSKRLLGHSLGMGSRLPAYCTSLGRVLLANLPEEELDRYMAQIKLAPYTEFTVTDQLEIRQMLSHVKRVGYAVVDQEMGLGLSGIAIPLRVGGYGSLMALSVTVNPKFVRAADIKDKYLHDMQDVAEQLCQL